MSKVDGKNKLYGSTTREDDLEFYLLIYTYSYDRREDISMLFTKSLTKKTEKGKYTIRLHKTNYIQHFKHIICIISFVLVQKKIWIKKITSSYYYYYVNIFPSKAS